MTFAQGLNVGDTASDFNLKNVDGSMVSMGDFPKAKGFVVVFTCNHCPFSKMYEARLIALHNAYAEKGYPVIAINPNDPAAQPDDSYEKMQIRADEKGFPFPYLFDDGQLVYPQYGATRTPHVYLLNKQADGSLQVAYIGAIDDNAKSADSVERAYLSNAIDALIAGEEVVTSFTKAIGCSIKTRS